MAMSRREFVQSAAGVAAVGLGGGAAQVMSATRNAPGDFKPAGRPVVIASANGEGACRQAVAFKVEALGADGKVAASAEVPAKQKTYELERLAPGTYALRFSAAGYPTLTVKGIVVKARNDLHVNVEFDGQPAKD